MKKMKIIFENPETRNRDSVVLDDWFKVNEQPGIDFTEFTLWKSAHDAAKSMEMVMLPNYGKVQKSSIKGFVEHKTKPEPENRKHQSRFEKEPPSDMEWGAILTATLKKFEGSAATPTIIRGISMSLWNMNNERTTKAIKFGLKIQAEQAEILEKMGGE